MHTSGNNFIEKTIRFARRAAKRRVRLLKALYEGLQYEAPNFVFLPKLATGAVVIDAGCSYQADFSLYMIRRFGVKAYAVDPTRKHRGALKLICDEHPGRFVHLPVAIGHEDGTATFYESRVNESGSMLIDHINVRRDETISYEVRVVSLGTLVKEIGAPHIEILKLDLEGAEYPLLGSIRKDDLLPFRQIFVEFHHHAVKLFNYSDTLRIVERIRSFGYRSFSLDDHNYLFYLD